MQNENLELNDTTRFLANTLHEIRTPIQTIIGAAELMTNTTLDKEQIEYIRQIQFSAEGLLELANNILDFAKLSQKEFRFETIPFDIASVTEHVVDSESIKAFNRGVELVLDISAQVPAMVSGDSMRVRQVMLNLVSNAVKFTKKGFVHVELDYTKADGIIFTVTDTGIGISAEKQKKLFTDYFQADISTYRLFGGTGLGLSISKNLIALMGGEIGVRSNPEGGSVFYFKIPLPVAIEKSPKIKFKKSIDDYCVLIVDDCLLAAQSLSRQLWHLGFRNVELCSDAREAIERIAQAEKDGHPFNLAFIDMQMEGGIDGWHLAFDIQHSEKVSEKLSLYLLVPEGQMREEAKMKFLDLYKGYLYKPIKKEMLLTLLSEEFSDGDSLDTVAELEEHADFGAAGEPKKIGDGLTILVAEDHPMNRKLLESFLKKFGAQVYLAENGEEAVSMAKLHPEVNMIFMDIFMPEKSGIEATKELRAMYYNGIIIACTANDDENDFADYKRIGINDILVKPFKSETLKSMIEKWKTVMQTLSVEQINLIDGELR